MRRRFRRRAQGVTAYQSHKEVARLFVHQRLAHWKTFYAFEYGQVRIKNHQRAWGSCSSKKNLNFNWRIIALPQELADYIILHELCHTIHLNHSYAFWNLLTTLLPTSRYLRAQLRAIPISSILYPPPNLSEELV